MFRSLLNFATSYLSQQNFTTVEFVFTLPIYRLPSDFVERSLDEFLKVFLIRFVFAFFNGRSFGFKNRSPSGVSNFRLWVEKRPQVSASPSVSSFILRVFCVTRLAVEILLTWVDFLRAGLSAFCATYFLGVGIILHQTSFKWCARFWLQRNNNTVQNLNQNNSTNNKCTEQSCHDHHHFWLSQSEFLLFSLDFLNEPKCDI